MSYFLYSISDPFMFNLCSKDRSCDHYSCERHSYGELRELRQTRFLLQVCPREGAMVGPSLHVTHGPGAINAPSKCEGHSSVYPFMPVHSPVPFGTHL